MTDIEFVLTSSISGLDTTGRQTADSLLKTSLLLPGNQPEIHTIKKIHAVIVQKELSRLDSSIAFKGRIKLGIVYESGTPAPSQEEFITFVPFSFCDQLLEPEKEHESIKAEFFLEYLRLVLKSPRNIFLEAGICVSYE